MTRKNDDISTEFNVRLKEAKLLNFIVASGSEFHGLMVLAAINYIVHRHAHCFQQDNSYDQNYGGLLRLFKCEVIIKIDVN